MTNTGTLRGILEEALMNLSNSSLKSFRRKLVHCEVPKQHKRIPWNKLEEADWEQVVDLIISYYTTEHAPQIVIEVLKDINERQACLDLKKFLMRNGAKTKHPRHKYYKRGKDDGEGETIPSRKINSDGTAERSSRMEMSSQMGQIPRVTAGNISAHLPRARNKGIQSDNTRQLSECNNQAQREVRLIHSPTQAPPGITRMATLEPTVECMQNQHKSNEPLLVSPNKRIKEEESQICISTPLQGTIAHHNQQKENTLITHTEFRIPATPYKCLENTNKGPTLDHSNIYAGTGVNCENISQVQEAAGYNNQSGYPELPHIPNIQCLSTEPRNRPKTTGISLTSAKRPQVKHIPPRGKPLPDMHLPELDEENLALIEANHKGKPHIFAKLLFRFFVPYETYKDWVKKTNFDGFGGKDAIPNNLREAILKQLRKRFNLQEEDKKKIKRTINGLLWKLRTGGWPMLM